MIPGAAIQAPEVVMATEGVEIGVTGVTSWTPRLFVK